MTGLDGHTKGLLKCRRFAVLAEIAETEPYRAPVGWLRCFRGIDTLTAMLILAELHDFRRFASASALMAYLGLVPGEDSSSPW
jgi:transposase